MLNQLKDLYKKGFSLLWLKAKSKAPLDSGWTKGPRIEWPAFQTRYKPNFNVGVRLGSTSVLADGSYLHVLDCDLKSDEPKHKLELLKAVRELFPDYSGTAAVISGRGNGSMHYYFKSKTLLKSQNLLQSKDKVLVHQPSARPSRTELREVSAEQIAEGWRLRGAWEISLMGEGRQVVLPPSVHPDSGFRYEWLGANPILDWKPNLKEHEKVSTGDGEDFRDVQVDLVSAPIPERVFKMIVDGDEVSDRSAALMTAAMSMFRGGMSRDQILSVLTDKTNFLGAVAYEHTKSDNRRRAMEWVDKYTLQKAKAEVSAAKDFEDEAYIEEEPLSEMESEAQTAELLELDNWRKQLDRNPQNYKVQSTMLNVKRIIIGTAKENTKDGLSLKHNEFSVDDIWLADMPWGSKRGRPVTDVDIIHIKDYLAQKWGIEPASSKIEEAVIQIARENKFHPVRDFLDGLEWDGVERLDTWLSVYLNAVGDKKYLSEIGKKTLCAMVGRIYKPGCKFDSVLILEGEQGVGKSTTARILGGEWFSDSFLNITDKDAVMNMQGVWVYELGELSAMNRSETNSLKEFISRSTDRIRPPYGRRTLQYPRQSIFIGTTNHSEYLKDRTGNRRFLPCEVGKVKMSKLERDRDQLLAEAKLAFQLGEDLYISDETVQKTAALIQTSRVEFDDLQESLAEFLDRLPTDFPDEFQILDILERGGKAFAGLRNDRPTQMRLSGFLRNLGYTNEPGWSVKLGRVVRRWRPKKLTTLQPLIQK